MTGRKAVPILVLILAMIVTAPSVVRGEEIALLNRLGVGVAYVDTSDESTIYLWGGIPTAYLKGSSIYGFNGRHLGWFENGIVWGHQGLLVGYTAETIATAGGTARVETVKGAKQAKPAGMPEESPPAKPVFIDSPSPVPLRDLLRLGRP